MSGGLKHSGPSSQPTAQADMPYLLNSQSHLTISLQIPTSPTQHHAHRCSHYPPTSPHKNTWIIANLTPSYVLTLCSFPWHTAPVFQDPLQFYQILTGYLFQGLQHLKTCLHLWCVVVQGEGGHDAIVPLLTRRKMNFRNIVYAAVISCRNTAHWRKSVRKFGAVRLF